MSTVRRIRGVVHSAKLVLDADGRPFKDSDKIVSYVKNRGGTGIPIQDTIRKTGFSQTLTPSWESPFEMKTGFAASYSLVMEVKRQNYGAIKILQRKGQFKTWLPVLLVNGRKIETGQLLTTVSMMGADGGPPDGAEAPDVPLVALSELLDKPTPDCIPEERGDSPPPDAGAEGSPAAPPPAPAAPAEDPLEEVEREFPGGAIYRGTMLGKNRHGQGQLTMPNGDMYDGKWKGNKMHGHGVHTWVSGARYDGEYVEGKMHGHGEYHYVDGSMYVGMWGDSVRAGLGRYTLRNGDYYDGIWVNGQKNGIGESLIDSGRVSCSLFVGPHKDNLRDGLGVMKKGRDLSQCFEVLFSRGQPKTTFPIDLDRHDELREAILGGGGYEEMLSEAVRSAAIS